MNPPKADHGYGRPPHPLVTNTHAIVQDATTETPILSFCHHYRKMADLQGKNNAVNMIINE